MVQAMMQVESAVTSTSGYGGHFIVIKRVTILSSFACAHLVTT